MYTLFNNEIGPTLISTTDFFDPSESLIDNIKNLSEEFEPYLGARQQQLFARTLQERAKCSPVMSRDQLISIRETGYTRLSALRSSYGSIGSGLDASDLMQKYIHFWDNMEGHSWCIYESDQDVFDQIQAAASHSNSIYNAAGNLFERNFRGPLSGMQNNIMTLRSASSSATINIADTLDAYNRFWASNFSFSLYWGFDPDLDNLMREYESLLNESNSLFKSANNRVQANFTAQLSLIGRIRNDMKTAYDHWNTIDGHVGYGQFDRILPDLNSAWSKWGQFVVLKTPENDANFQKANDYLSEIKGWFAKFLELKPFQESSGIKKGGGIGAHKFFAEAGLLTTLKSIGAEFRKQSIDETGYEFRNLFITSLSYEHGGKIPPHAEHRIGKDADVWTRRLDQRKTDFDKERTTKIVVALLRLGVKRVIYTHANVVKDANAKVPTNAVAVNLGNHKDHIHFDI